MMSLDLPIIRKKKFVKKKKFKVEFIKNSTTQSRQVQGTKFSSIGSSSSKEYSYKKTLVMWEVTDRQKAQLNQMFRRKVLKQHKTSKQRVNHCS